MIASFLLVGEQDYAATMVRALKDVHQCPVIQMSDLKTPKVPGVDEVVRIPFKVPLMLYRFKHLAHLPHDEMLIVDTDVIAKAPIDDVWAHRFDVGLTHREPGELYDGDGDDLSSEMPFNTGVMFSRTNQFWADCYQWLSSQSAAKQRWYGDQLGVAEMVSRGTYEVLGLPCKEFNWAPSSINDGSNARFYHFKGAIRKKWINQYVSSSASTAEKLPRTQSAANPS